MDNIHRYFATTVALITTNGRNYDKNVMAAEWTMQVSYDPMIIAVFVHKSPTYWNMLETRSFGVNLASDEQAELVNLAGGYSRNELQKLSIPGTFSTYQGGLIDVPMIRGCVLNAECRLVKAQRIGDHIMVLGKVLLARYDDSKLPLIYTRGNYRKMARSKIPSGRIRVRLSPSKFASFEKLASGQFVLKAAACFAKSKDKLLLEKFNGGWIPPFAVVKKGSNYAQALEEHLRSLGFEAKIGRIASLSRMTLTDGKTSIRANFVAYRCHVESFKDTGRASWLKWPHRNVVLRRQLLQYA